MNRPDKSFLVILLLALILLTTLITFQESKIERYTVFAQEETAPDKIVVYYDDGTMEEISPASFEEFCKKMKDKGYTLIEFYRHGSHKREYTHEHRKEK